MNTANAYIARRHGARIAGALAGLAALGIVATMTRGAIVCAFTRADCPAPVRSAVWFADDVLHGLTGLSIVVYTQPEISINLVNED